MNANLNHREDGCFASIDLGTNNCRLMIARPAANGLEVITSYSKITRLGEGIVSEGYLSQKAIDRTMEALKVCARRIDEHKPLKVRCVATEACRRARNAQDFISKAKNDLGLDFEIISSNEESRLAMMACLPLLKPDIKYLVVFDIGGGSSEIAFSEIDSGGVLDFKGSLSLPLGVLTVSEGFTGIDLSGRARETLADKIYSAMYKIDEQFDISEKILENQVQVIGTSGTVTSLGAFHLKLNHYNRRVVDGLSLTLSEVQAARSRLENMTNQERIMHCCIGPQRADLTLAGCAILGAICDFWPMREMTIADRGIREGILIDLIKEYKNAAG